MTARGGVEQDEAPESDIDEESEDEDFIPQQPRGHTQSHLTAATEPDSEEDSDLGDSLEDEDEDDDALFASQPAIQSGEPVSFKSKLEAALMGVSGPPAGVDTGQKEDITRKGSEDDNESMEFPREDYDENVWSQKEGTSTSAARVNRTSSLFDDDGLDVDEEDAALFSRPKATSSRGARRAHPTLASKQEERPPQLSPARAGNNIDALQPRQAQETGSRIPASSLLFGDDDDDEEEDLLFGRLVGARATSNVTPTGLFTDEDVNLDENSNRIQRVPRAENAQNVDMEETQTELMDPGASRPPTASQQSPMAKLHAGIAFAASKVVSERKALHKPDSDTDAESDWGDDAPTMATDIPPTENNAQGTYDTLQDPLSLASREEAEFHAQSSHTDKPRARKTAASLFDDDEDELESSLFGKATDRESSHSLFEGNADSSKAAEPDKAGPVLGDQAVRAKSGVVEEPESHGSRPQVESLGASVPSLDDSMGDGEEEEEEAHVRRPRGASKSQMAQLGANFATMAAAIVAQRRPDIDEDSADEHDDVTDDDEAMPDTIREGFTQDQVGIPVDDTEQGALVMEDKDSADASLTGRGEPSTAPDTAAREVGPVTMTQIKRTSLFGDDDDDDELESSLFGKPTGRPSPQSLFEDDDDARTSAVVVGTTKPGIDDAELRGMSGQLEEPGSPSSLPSREPLDVAKPSSQEGAVEEEEEEAPVQRPKGASKSPMAQLGANFATMAAAIVAQRHPGFRDDSSSEDDDSTAGGVQRVADSTVKGWSPGQTNAAAEVGKNKDVLWPGHNPLSVTASALTEDASTREETRVKRTALFGDDDEDDDELEAKLFGKSKSRSARANLFDDDNTSDTPAAKEATSSHVGPETDLLPALSSGTATVLCESLLGASSADPGSAMEHVVASRPAGPRGKRKPRGRS
eukprot:scaffold346_cov387-Prasinococcus_capsulatus_cf.AAC.19